MAMAHDVLLLLGVFAWLGKTLDGVFLAALLTVIGYSIDDSVVVLDRIRAYSLLRVHRHAAGRVVRRATRLSPRRARAGAASVAAGEQSRTGDRDAGGPHCRPERRNTLGAVDPSPQAAPQAGEEALK